MRLCVSLNINTQLFFYSKLFPSLCCSTDTGLVDAQSMCNLCGSHLQLAYRPVTEQNDMMQCTWCVNAGFSRHDFYYTM